MVSVVAEHPLFSEAVEKVLEKGVSVYRLVAKKHICLNSYRN